MICMGVAAGGAKAEAGEWHHSTRWAVGPGLAVPWFPTLRFNLNSPSQLAIMVAFSISGHLCSSLGRRTTNVSQVSCNRYAGKPTLDSVRRPVSRTSNGSLSSQAMAAQANRVRSAVSISSMPWKVLHSISSWTSGWAFPIGTQLPLHFLHHKMM